MKSYDPQKSPDAIRTESSRQERRPGRFHTRLSMGMGQVWGTIERGEPLGDSDVSSLALAQTLDFGVAMTTDLALSLRLEVYLPFDSEIADEGKSSDALMLAGRAAGTALMAAMVDAGVGLAYRATRPRFIQIFGRG
jgi:hypothetical protein